MTNELDVDLLKDVDLSILDNLSKDEKLSVLDDAIHRLNFERRLASLSENQLINMSDFTLSQPQIDRLNKCENDVKRDEVLAEYARINYFRQCAWSSYLNGDTKEPPVPAIEESAVVV